MKYNRSLSKRIELKIDDLFERYNWKKCWTISIILVCVLSVLYNLEGSERKGKRAIRSQYS
jgi:hypothetical protein